MPAFASEPAGPMPAGPGPAAEPSPEPVPTAIVLAMPAPEPLPAEPPKPLKRAPVVRTPGIPRGISKQGLTAKQVQESRLKHGFNEVLEKKKHPILLFLETFYGPVPFMLIVTAVIAGVLRQWETMGMVIALLLANSCIGFWEEGKAAAAVDALMARLTIEAKVKRDGKWFVISSRELVPGDTVRLRAGDFVPADCIVIEDTVSCDESFITGESLPKRWGPGSLLFSGSQVARGECTVVITATGRNTNFAKTVELVASSSPQMHSEIVTGRVAFVLLVATMIVAGCVAFFVAVHHMSLVAALPNIIMLVASGMPSGLPAMFKLTMALGSQELTKHGVLISSLEATEDAARMTVLCADKTGTLTQNKLSVEGIKPVPRLLLTGGPAFPEVVATAAAPAVAVPPPQSPRPAASPSASSAQTPASASSSAIAAVLARSSSFSGLAPSPSPRRDGGETDSSSAAAAEAVILLAAALASSDANADAIDTAVTQRADSHTGAGANELRLQLFGHPLGKKAAADAKENAPPGLVPSLSRAPSSEALSETPTNSASSSSAPGGAASLQSHWRLIRFIPFDPSTRRTEAIVENVYTGKRMRCVKGAVKEVLALCKESNTNNGTGPTSAAASFFISAQARQQAEAEDEIESWAADAEADFASRAFRTLAVAASEMTPLQPHDPSLPVRPSTPDKNKQPRGSKDSINVNTTADDNSSGNVGSTGSEEDIPLPNEGKLYFLGVMGLQDPPRPDTAACVQALRELGVRTLMITGDTQKIAVEISKRVGIAGLAGEMRSEAENKVVEIDCLAPHDDELAFEHQQALRRRRRAKSPSEGDHGKGDEEEAFIQSDEGLRNRTGGSGGLDTAQRSALALSDLGAGDGIDAVEREPIFVNLSDLPPPIQRKRKKIVPTTPAPAGGNGSGPTSPAPTTAPLPSVAAQMKAHSSPDHDGGWTGKEDLSLEPELLDAVLKADGFAGVFPSQKHKLIAALQYMGICAGMTGDGINDAPALKQAEVGVAVSNATDVAKKSARVVLTKDGLSGIIELVRVSRTIHERVETWVVNKVAKEFAVVFFIVALFFISKAWIIGAFEAAVLLISQNIVTLSLAADNATGSSRPQEWNITPLFTVGVIVGFISFSSGLGFFYIALGHLGYTMGDPRMRTVCFELVSFLCAFNVMVVRERKWWWSSLPAWPVTVANGLGSLVVVIIATVGVPELPKIPFSHTILIILWSMLSSLLVADVAKIAYSTGCFCAARRRRLQRNASEEEKKVMKQAHALLGKDGEAARNNDSNLDTSKTFFGLPCRNKSRRTCRKIRDFICCRDSSSSSPYSSSPSSPTAKGSSKKGGSSKGEIGVAKAAEGVPYSPLPEIASAAKKSS
jgi:magnesium-transporting ATPase (P-type)